MVDVLNWRVNARSVEGRTAVVVGAGASGLAAARLLLRLGARVHIVDANENLDPTPVKALGRDVELLTGKHSKDQFEDAAMVVLSPGVPVKKLAPALEDVPSEKIVAELELASRFVECPVIAVTGTNGKTTTTMIIEQMLKAAGKTVFMGGNIGTPLSEHVLDGQEADVVLLEVSSFQLQNCHTFRPDVAMLLNFSANHLDYHEDMEEYLSAKLKIFANQGPGDHAVVPLEMRGELVSRDFTRAGTIWFKDTNRFPKAKLTGIHNRHNMEAAWCAVHALGVDLKAAAKAMRDFKAPSHRLEVVSRKKGVTFVDDSKATNLDAVRAAVMSFDKPVRLLAGGVFKGGDVNELAEAMRGRVVQVGLFGDSRDIFEKALADKFNTFWEPTLRDAVKRLYKDSRKGDVILLSPATSSFDLYKSYAERGDDFKKTVKEL